MRNEKSEKITNELFSWFEANQPKLRRMIIKNFRSIGSRPVTIDLDDIVVLVGPNNAGKSSILKAYELVMNHGSNKCYLSETDFPNGKVDSENLPEIEIHTMINGDTSPANRWVLFDKELGQAIVKERWIWSAPNKNPKRQGFDVEKNDWDDQVPWGAPNVAKDKRPQPHMVEAFAQPQEQEKQIIDIITAIIKDRIKGLQKQETDSDGETEYSKLLSQITNLRKKILNESKKEIEAIENNLSDTISKIFPNYVVKIDPKEEENVENDISLFKKQQFY